MKSTVALEIRTAHLLNPHAREDPKTFGCLDAPNVPEPLTEPLDRSTFPPEVAPPRHPGSGVAGEDDQGPAAVASPPTASATPLPQQSGARAWVQEEEEWEIR